MAKNQNRPDPGAQQAACSETQRLLQQMRSGEAWSHEAAALGYMVGGNEGAFAAENRLDLEFEEDEDEGYPTPT